MLEKTLGQIAFEAYKDYVEGLTYDGKQIPNWEDLKETIKQAWEVAVNAAIKG